MAPLYKAAPRSVYSWTGCYVGGHVGWGWGRTNLTDQSVLNLGGPPLSVTEFSPIDNNGALFGGQLGCNYQFAGNWVAGIEGSLAATNFNGVGHESTFEVAFGGVGDDTVKVKKDWLASVTGRLGVAPWDPRTLFYVKGGAAVLIEHASRQNARAASVASGPKQKETVGRLSRGTDRRCCECALSD